MNSITLSQQEIEELRAAYEALQKENAELKATISNLTKAYERESNDCLKALEERDYWYEKADSLADKISECFDVPIGEHSNVNCPIVEAMKILTGEYVTKFDRETAAQAKRIAELEDRLAALPIPTLVATQKIVKLRAQGFKEYASTVLSKDNQYCIVGDYGDVRWASKNGE